MAERPREIYLTDGNLSEMGPITHIAEVPMEIGGHRKLATLQVTIYKTTKSFWECRG